MRRYYRPSKQYRNLLMENQDLQNQLWEAKKNSQKKQFGVDQWERAFKKLHRENKRIRCELQHANKELEKPIRTHKECREKSEALENSNIQLTKDLEASRHKQGVIRARYEESQKYMQHKDVRNAELLQEKAELKDKTQSLEWRLGELDKYNVTCDDSYQQTKQKLEQLEKIYSKYVNDTRRREESMERRLCEAREDSRRKQLHFEKFAVNVSDREFHRGVNKVGDQTNRKYDDALIIKNLENANRQLHEDLTRYEDIFPMFHAMAGDRQVKSANSSMCSSDSSRTSKVNTGNSADNPPIKRCKR